MIKNTRYILVAMLSVAMTMAVVAPAFAGGTTGKMDRHATIEGVLTIKEAHGDFLVRTPDGKTQRFSVKGDMAITRNGKPAHYKDMKTDDAVEVQYEAANRRVIAIRASGS
jgi:hypothetical protein